MQRAANERQRRQRFLEAANRAYAALRQDRAAWRQEQAERRAWEGLQEAPAGNDKPGWGSATRR